MYIYLVRHGETDWNRERRIQGSTDIPLNDTGRAQARATGKLLSRRAWDSIYASPLSRAMETGAIIAARLGIAPPQALPEVVERSYGAAEGRTDDELDELYPPGSEVPGRETREAVAERVVPALVKLAEDNDGKYVVVVVHGGVIASVLAAVAPHHRHGAITNGSIHSFKHDAGSLTLVAFDDPIETESIAYGGADFAEQNAVAQREDSP